MSILFKNLRIGIPWRVLAAATLKRPTFACFNRLCISSTNELPRSHVIILLLKYNFKDITNALHGYLNLL